MRILSLFRTAVIALCSTASLFVALIVPLKGGERNAKSNENDGSRRFNSKIIISKETT
jgi:hypothetical protein